MKEKDELISGAELARRLNFSQPYLTKNKIMLKNSKCMYGKKYYFRKSALVLGKDPDNPHKTTQSTIQKDKNKSNENWNVYTDDNAKKKVNEILEDLKPEKKHKEKKQTIEDNEDEETNDGPIELETLKKQIENAIANKNNNKDYALLNGIKQKASILVEYQKSINEEIKNKKLQEDTFSKDEVLKILGTASNMIRNSLLNLANNYSINLEGLNKKEIKEYVQDDINRILEDFQSTADRFN